MSYQMPHPAEYDIARVMAETGMDRIQAINHLRQRRALAQAYQQQRRETVGGLLNRIV